MALGRRRRNGNCTSKSALFSSVAPFSKGLLSRKTGEEGACRAAAGGLRRALPSPDPEPRRWAPPRAETPNKLHPAAVSPWGQNCVVLWSGTSGWTCSWAQSCSRGMLWCRGRTRGVVSAQWPGTPGWPGSAEGFACPSHSPHAAGRFLGLFGTRQFFSSLFSFFSSFFSSQEEFYRD